MIAIWAIVSVVLVSMISLLGAIFISLKRKLLEGVITYSLALSSGVLLGSAFLQLLPESVELLGSGAFSLVLAGMVTFFCLEKLIHWHHHVEGDEHQEDEKPVAYLTLIGDAIHNFADGAVIGAAYLVSIPLGITTTLAVIAHEIPHELSDFLILIHGGFSNRRALKYNFLSATTAIAGTLLVLFMSAQSENIERYLVPFATGNFIYIAASDLIPELLKKRKGISSIIQILLLIVGIFLVTVIASVMGSA
ncbi:ZIP family metal transporter [Candidatus Woesebacteria bacterium]|jgi:zinc and cadmium transporter|nr:ZIP family metal transporter [Candidatus Woesebacteria bacterium]